ncbi:MAG: hypothetical protein JSW60_02685 [Thermoplasmatales archaeon]|nr:MAG: hypothetical protein JSW60_02685 [Thermoplasmatales archaeon]
MAKKMRRVRTFARTATKSQEKKLIENSKKLRDNPFIILPECIDESCKKYFVKTRKRLEKISRFADDLDKLEKLSNKKGLEGAFAGTLSLALSEKAPYLGVLKFPTGDITYAQRGKAEKEKLIAVQHFDDPIWRLLGIKDLAFKKKLHVYSWDKGFVCTGLKANPPKEFVDFIINKLGFSHKNNVIFCKHINPEKARNQEFLNEYYLRINWKSTGKVIAICEDCTKSTKNTMFNISKYMLSPDLSYDFEIDVVAQVVKRADQKQDTKYLQDYLSGKLTDHEFIHKNIKKQEEMVKQSEEKILVLDGVSYGSNVKRFVDALKPNKYEKMALEFILEKIEEPLIVSEVSSNKILEMYWDQHAKEFINSIVDDKQMADSLFQLDDTPSNILTMVFEYRERQKILSKLPQYTSLPPLANFADTVARTYKTFGKKETLSEIKKKPDTPKGRSLAYAFLLVFRKGEDTKWQYSKQEIEYGEFLKEYAKNLLEAEPQKYSKALQDLLTASGSNEKIV